MIAKAITRAFEQLQNKQWEKTYWAFDIHETIVKPNWSAANIAKEFYPLAREAMQMITKRRDIVVILYTCSHPSEIESYIAYFKTHHICVDYVNQNPEVANGTYGCFDTKPYFNVLFEDKAGFDANKDWKTVIDLLKSNTNGN